MTRLKNKVSIITGGASGIGEAISKIFYQEGSKICVIDNNSDKLETFEKSINSKDNLLKIFVKLMLNILFDFFLKVTIPSILA